MKASITDNVGSIILAGGQGKRLFPLTQTRCKPAVVFGGEYRLIDIPLSNSFNSGIKHIYVISQYFSSFLHEHIMQTYPIDHTREAKMHLISPEEKVDQKIWYHGTADAIRQNLDHLRQTPFDYFLILSGDQLYNMDYTALLRCAKEKDADLVVAALPVQLREAKRMGLLKIDRKGHIADFYEKPQDSEVLKFFALPKAFMHKRGCHQAKATHYLGSMGIYVFKRNALFRLLNESGDDFGKNLIPKQVKKGNAVAYVFEGYWEDIGTVSSFYEANIALTRASSCLNMYDDKKPIFARPQNLPSALIRGTKVNHSFICQGSLIEAKEISHSIIGMRSHIKKGTVLQGCILLGNLFYTPPRYQSPPLPQNFTIGENCVLKKVIIDEHVHIGNNVRLINQRRVQDYEGKGIYIREGIIIVAAGTHLPDGFVL